MTPGVPPTAARFRADLVAAATAPLPAPAAEAARRSLFNVLGTAVGAARTPALDAVVAAALGSGASGPVAVPGRAEGLDEHWGALAVGTAAHLDDFDDTHLATVIHPGAAILAALLALEPAVARPGSAYLTAFALGCEAQLRIGNAVSPSHYDRGWHITGTCGVFGAAVAAAVLLELDAAALGRALDLAGTMVLGHREAFGSMTKPLHPGQAAANGVLAARLAAGPDGPADAPDAFGPGGVLGVFSDGVDAAELFGSWERDWELERNAFKPYPCGIVAHPVIDAAIGAAGLVGDPAGITAVRIDCHPLVPELMGRRDPADGLQARFSAYHAAAVGLLDGHVGLPQFADERAVAPDAAALRALITLLPDPARDRDEARITVERNGSGPVELHVPHARGSLARPLTEDELTDKVHRLVEPVLGAAATAAIRAAVWALDAAPDPAGLLAALRPTPEVTA
jgi:2-methylcitrate dehydratase PrpD